MLANVLASAAAEAARFAFHSWHAGLTVFGAMVAGGLVYLIAKASE
jgi:hypothetical protein